MPPTGWQLVEQKLYINFLHCSRYGFTPLDIVQTLGNCTSIVPLLTPKTSIFHLPE